MLDTDTKTSEETWNAIAHSFDVTRRKPWIQCIAFINTLSKTDFVADIGCGNGRHLLPCAKYCKYAIGVDISRELLNIVQKKLQKNIFSNVVLLHSDVTYLPIKDESVNAALFIASLHNIKGRERRIQALIEIKRILKKDGRALISVWSRWQDKYRKQFFKKWFTQLGGTQFGDIDIYWKQHNLNIPRFYHLYSRKELMHDIQEADLEILDFLDVKLHSKKYPDNFFVNVKKK